MDGYGSWAWPDAVESPDQIAARYVEVINTCWPPNPRGSEQGRVPVYAWICWAGGASEWMDGVAIRWRPRHVLVRINDRRIRGFFVWLALFDVARRTDLSRRPPADN